MTSTTIVRTPSPARRRLHLVVLALATLASTLVSPAARSAPPAIELAAGAGSFVFVDRAGDRSRPLTVYTYLPERLPAAAARVVFVMHGAGKNARGYRDTWIEHAERHGWLIVAPRFDAEQWGGGAYSYASVHGGDARVRDPSLWSFSDVEHLFDAIRDSTGNTSSHYFLYGHSEGGQFVHRLVLLLPGARYSVAVAANPGWYTMPRLDADYPYGLARAPVTATSLAKSLGRRFVLLLGDQDTDPGHPQLRKTPEAMAQGAHRFERGHRFMNEARRSAAELGTALEWQLRVVPGAAHQNRPMSQAAASLLAERWPMRNP